MKTHHWLHIRTGRYALSDHVHFDVSGNDAGVLISLHDLERKVSYWVDVRDGKVNIGDVKAYGVKSTAVEPLTVWGRFKAELAPEGYLPETGVEFSVEFPNTPLPPRRLRALGAYRRQDETRVIYREVAAGVFRDKIARFRPSGEIVLNMRRGPTCLLPSDWMTFGNVAAGGKFRLGRRMWEKLARKDMSELLADKTFRSTL